MQKKNMTRLNPILLAAARGARIQTRYSYHDTFTRWGEWKTVSGMVFEPEKASHQHEQRVHPDDVHLCQLKSLYELTGDIKDINTLLLPLTS